MNRSISIQPQVSQDIDRVCGYLAKTNRDRAMAFLDAVRQTFADLARMPGVGKSMIVVKMILTTYIVGLLRDLKSI